MMANPYSIVRDLRAKMRKRSIFSGIVFLLISIPFALFLNLFLLKEHFNLELPFWNVNLLLYVELAIVLLGLIWVLYSFAVSKILKANFREILEKDLFTYIPLYLLLFYFLDLAPSTWFSTPILLGVTLLIIIILKVAVILHIKNVKKLSYFLIITIVVLPLLLVNYFTLKSHYLSDATKRTVQLKISKEIIEGRLKNEYNADPLSLFNEDIAGVYKKKIGIGGEIRNTLILQPPKKIEAKVTIPAESYLQFGLGALKETYVGEGDGIQFNVFLKIKSEVKKIYTKYIDPKHNEKDREFYDLNLDLRDYANKEALILFEVLGSAEIRPPFERKVDNRDDYAVISDPKIVSYNPKVRSAAKNIIFISLDTVRADHLGCYGYKRVDISPNIDKLSKEGILFENAISHSPWTVPSHMSMFTSLLPSYHQVNESILKSFMFRHGSGGYRVLSEDVTTLAKVFKSNGYLTAAFTGGVTMIGKMGFCLGFDTYDNKPYDSFACNSGFKKVTKWLEINRRQPFFLFLHTFRPHYPFRGLKYAPEVMKESEIEELKRYLGSPSWDPREERKGERIHYKKEIGEAFYDGGIYETDKYVGKLIAVLKKLNLSKNTIILLTSDHGEEFGEHRSEKIGEHGHSLYDELIRVPLIIVAPDIFPEGKRIKSQVRHIDLMPTLLDLCSIKYNATKMQGISLKDIVKGNNANINNLLAVSEGMNTGPELKSIRSNNFKYIYTTKFKKRLDGERILVDDNPDKEELYDLGHDQAEKYNLTPIESNLSKKLKNKINETLKGAVKELSTAEKNKRIIPNKEMKKGLRALGYIQ
jgi:arylsulfatase A-like enzyme